jgi:hypothetical protein
LLITPSVRADGQGDLRPIERAGFGVVEARHLLERAGFGGTPEEVQALADLGPKAAVRRLVFQQGLPPAALPAFVHSGVWDEGLADFPPSRPATTERAAARGEARGIGVKPAGNRPTPAIVNQFFYWLRASRLETGRVAAWWANRMVATDRPLVEKMALFWHGHFATNEDKVRDYRKMLRQLELFQREGLGNFGKLLLGVAQDPAMLVFLDAGVNVRGAPNENFARETMELFSMGPGNYTENDIREAARAFTGWNNHELEFHIDPARHDDGPKTFLGHTGDFGGEEVIAIILDQPVTAEFMAAEVYRFFVRDEPDEALVHALGARLRALDYEIAPFLETLFLSRDFYSEAAIATHIKSPVELVVSTYRKLGLDHLPGVPDFNATTAALGQALMHPPTVAGWSQGRAWITPGLLMERGNFVLDVVFPDIGFVPPDRYPYYGGGDEILAVQTRLRTGASIAEATQPANPDVSGASMAQSNRLADRDEAFNTRYGSYRGWQMALERVLPMPRDVARLQLAQMVVDAGCATPEDVVDHLVARFWSVGIGPADRVRFAELLADELGTRDVVAAASWLEEPLRILLHVLLSAPEYQLG